MSQEEKINLAKLDLSIAIFEGDLREAINQELLKNNQYTAETLSLKREDKGYIKSKTSYDVRKTIENIATEKNIAQVLYWNVITGENDELDKLESVKDEFENSRIVNNFYKETFFKYIFSKIDIDNQVKANALHMPESSVYMKELCDEIEKIGISKYKDILDEYNKSLEQLRENGKLPTPQKIVDLNKENKKIDLVLLIEQLDEKLKEQDKAINTLSSAIDATKERTRISSINEQARKIKEQYKSEEKAINTDRSK